MNWKEAREHRLLDQEYERLNERDRKVSVFTLQEIFYADRPSMDKSNRDVNMILDRLTEELQEAKNPPTNHLGKDKHQIQEFVDIALFALAGIRALGGDPEVEIREKMARNLIKFQPKFFLDNVDFLLGISVSNLEWKADQGDQTFYADV